MVFTNTFAILEKQIFRALRAGFYFFKKSERIGVGFYLLAVFFSDIRDFLSKKVPKIFARFARGRVFILFKNFPALRAGFYSFQKILAKSSMAFIFSLIRGGFYSQYPGMGNFYRICSQFERRKTLYRQTQ